VVKHSKREAQVPNKLKEEFPTPFKQNGHQCLNCGRVVHEHFCGHCGQKAHTHRLTVKHFVAHDLVHGLFHVDRGIFHTLREVTLRPGYAGLEYIRGKRTGKFPIVTLLLILVATLLFIHAHNPWHNANDTLSKANRDFRTGVEISGSNPAPVLSIMNALAQNVKWLLLALVPLNALTTWMVFRRVRLNWAEHLLLNSYFFAGSLVVVIAVNLVYLAVGLPFETAGLGMELASVFYVVGYWQAFKKPYTVGGFAVRTLAEVVLSTLLFMILGTLLIAGMAIVAAVMMQHK